MLLFAPTRGRELKLHGGRNRYNGGAFAPTQGRELEHSSLKAVCGRMQFASTRGRELKQDREHRLYVRFAPHAGA